MSNKKEIKNVAIYARQSSGDDRESISIESQVEKLQEFAGRNSYNVVIIERDLNMRGRTYPDLPSARKKAEEDDAFLEEMKRTPKRNWFRKGLANVTKRMAEIDAVLIYDNTRLMRPVTNSYLDIYMRQHLIKNNCVLQTVNGEITDFSKHIDSLVDSIASQVQDNALQVLKRKTEEGRARLRREGMLWNSSVVNSYGYEQAGKQKVKVVENEAAIVREIFDLFLNKAMTIIGIARLLNSRGVPTKTKKGLWRHDSIRYILRRHHYAGFDYADEQKLQKVIIKPLIGKTLISEGMYWQTQEIMAKSKKFKTYHTNTVHPLTGLLFCGYCKSRAQLQSRREYMCHDNCVASPRTKANKGCRLTRINEVKKGDAKRNGLYECLQPLILKAMIENVATDDGLSALTAKSFELELELDKIKKLEQELTDLRVSGTISFDQLQNGLSKHNIRRESLVRELAEVGKKQRLLSAAKPLNTGEVSNILTSVFQNEVDPTVYERLISKVVKSIELFAYKIRVFFHDGTSFELDRILFGSSRVLPLFSCQATHTYSELKKIKVFYFYKSALEIGGLVPFNESDSFKGDEYDETQWDYEKMGNRIYNHGDLEIYTIGQNPEPFSWPSKKNREKRCQMLDYVINPDNYELPGYLQKLKS